MVTQQLDQLEDLEVPLAELARFVSDEDLPDHPTGKLVEDPPIKEESGDVPVIVRIPDGHGSSG